MSGSEIGAIVVGLLLGYWIISAFLPKKAARDSSTGPQRAKAAGPKQQSESATRSGAWHEVLGITAGASAEEIRGAYRNLIGQYHPDKVASMGEEIRLVAERKSKEIIAAYQEGMRSRGSAQ